MCFGAIVGVLTNVAGMFLVQLSCDNLSRMQQVRCCNYTLQVRDGSQKLLDIIMPFWHVEQALGTAHMTWFCQDTEYLVDENEVEEARRIDLCHMTYSTSPVF